MNIHESTALFGVMAGLAAMPGAGVALVVTRSAAQGVASGLSVAAGIVLGDLVFVALAVLGLSAVAEAMGSLFVMVRIAGGLYLLWFGFSLLANGRAGETMNRAPCKGNLFSGFAAGLVLTLGDIKAVLFYASVLPAFVDLSLIQGGEIAEIVLITVFSVGGVKSAYAVFARRLAARTQGTGLEAAARKTAGGLMIGAGGYLIVKA